MSSCYCLHWFLSYFMGSYVIGGRWQRQRPLLELQRPQNCIRLCGKIAPFTCCQHVIWTGIMLPWKRWGSQGTNGQSRPQKLLPPNSVLGQGVRPSVRETETRSLPPSPKPFHVSKERTHCFSRYVRMQFHAWQLNKAYLIYSSLQM